MIVGFLFSGEPCPETAAVGIEVCDARLMKYSFHQQVA
jgi:hypothetical protein